MNPQFPLYIISKGRADSRYTSRSLEHMGVPYYVVVETQEYEQYARVINPAKLLILDPRFQDEFDPFDTLGRSKSLACGPARNFAWDHAIRTGFAWHWIMDDNIRGFYRLNNNRKTPVADGTIFRCMEDFCLRYSNIAMAGPNYFMFASRKSKMPPLVLNTRLYSCNLIRNDVPYRWRGRYNDDTDLSLRMLKGGWCTVQFNAFLQYKCPTQTVPGGLQKDIYSVEGTKEKSAMLVRMHPDVTRLVWKFGRWHHEVDYRPFRKNRLKRDPNIPIEAGTNNYGMELVRTAHATKHLSLREIPDSEFVMELRPAERAARRARRSGERYHPG